ncbi:hypothetical protein VTK26DRAFT_3171 [Humicola hyalothermophila]
MRPALVWRAKDMGEDGAGNHGHVRPSLARPDDEASSNEHNGTLALSGATGQALSAEVADSSIKTEELKELDPSRPPFQDRDSTMALPPIGYSATAESNALARKRKPLDFESEESRLALNRATIKRVKLAEAAPTRSSLCLDKSLLPPEVWHYIFTVCPPKTLGNLLSVNKLFNLYLDPASSVNREVPVSVTGSALTCLKPNAIWRASRRLFWPQMPAPFHSKTELDMWRLICSPRCQDCGRLDVRNQKTSLDTRHPGPGSEGVAVVWPFAARLCASCLLKNTVKEVDLLLSPSIPSAVVPAVPFVFLTQDLHIFSAASLEQAQLPADAQLAKRFSLSDVEALKQEFLQVKDMGEGTVAEWLKGLPGRGNDMQHAASKWEKWEHSGGLTKVRSQLHPGYVNRPPAASMDKKPSTDRSPAQTVNLPAPASGHQSLSQGRHERTAEEAAQHKAARKAEIERRALLLDPPLTADVLHHIPSFQAATHIATPLDDHAWEVLKPRLLAQRADGEKAREAGRATQAKLGQNSLEHPPAEATLASSKEARDRIDKKWEDVQAPLRAKIAGYADEVIRNNWGKGKKVKRENCSQFAVGVLLHVRTRFYAEVAKDAAAAWAAGNTPPADPPEGPFTQKLTLENMKWIFDTKIKPHTECFRKELFYCNGCEGNLKPFGFEGVIQHYAAKHTTALSLGNTVVHWRAEWPELPPFSAEARPAKPSLQQGPGIFPLPGGPTPHTNIAYQPPANVPAPLPPTYPPSVGYGYNAPNYSEYHQPPPVPVPPPYPYQTQPPPFVAQPGYGPPQQYVSPAAPYPPYPTPAAPYIGPVVEPWRGYSGQYDHPPAPYQGAPSASIPLAPPLPPAYPSIYQTRLEDIARNSREVWRLLDDIKDLPGSLRVFVTIHHLVKRFRSRFGDTPPLSMFIDGLSNNKDMRPVRNVNGLVCKACHLGLGNAASVEKDRKDFSLPQLANHFQTKHVEPMQRAQMPNPPPTLDWVVDMVLLPDNSTISRFVPSRNEPQKSLLADAFPDLAELESVPAPATQTSQYQRLASQSEPVTAAGYHITPANVTDVRMSNGHFGGSVDMDKGASKPADNRNSTRSSNTATPVTLSDNDRSTDDQGGRDSSQGLRPSRVHGSDQDGKHMASKKKRGMPQAEGGSGSRPYGKRFRMDTGERQSRGADLRDGHATQPVGAPSRHSPPGYSEPTATVGVSAPSESAPRPLQQPTGNRPLRQSHPAPRSDRRDVNIMGALESYLEQRYSTPLRSQQEETALDTDSRDANAGPRHDSVQAGYTQTRHGDRRYQGDSRRQPPRYETVRPASGERMPFGDEFERTYDSRAGLVERRHDGYAVRHPRAGFVDPMTRHVEEGRYAWAVRRPEDRDQDPARLEPGCRQYHGDARVHPPRRPVEAYEIVHVIDESGEYYIRRPARREPEPLYVYEERRPLYRDSVSYPPLQHTYAPVSRQSMVRESARASMAPDGGAVHDRWTDTVHHGEYDPRFPAA